MSTDYQNLQLDGYNFDDYFNALISPVQYEKRPETMMMEFNKLKESNYSENKNPMPKLEFPNVLPNLKIPTKMSYMQQNNAPNQIAQSKTINKRKSLSESSRNIQVKEEQLEEFEEETDSSSVSSSPKKSKKNPKTTPKKKKEAPKRKRVNYCFEIHRSGCQMNKDSKLYCKVFLKGKLQSEVDLIKGARGKWAYTFYDQRKDKKERRYWPSQSSGPVIEDPCNCDKCTPTSINEEEVDFSSPSTEDATLIDYETQNIGNQYVQDYNQQVQYVDQNNIVYYMPSSYHSIEEFQYCIKNSTDFQNNIALKSSNDFQDRNQYYQVSNELLANQRGNWESQSEYQNDNFFVENNFL